MQLLKVFWGISWILDFLPDLSMLIFIILVFKLNFEFSNLNKQSDGRISIIGRDQLNSRFHGRDIFREIDLLP